MRNNILVISAHSDDETLGCGGTISKLVSNGHLVTALFMTDGVSSREGNCTSTQVQKRIQSAKKATEILGISHLQQCDFPDNALDTVSLLNITQVIEAVIVETQPHTIFTHYLNDLNIDHSIVARATLTAARPVADSPVKRVIAYEVNSSTEWAFGSPQFSPNYFVNISDTFKVKVKAMRAYENELRDPPHPRSIEGIKALASLRGNAVGYEYAEAFEIYRLSED